MTEILMSAPVSLFSIKARRSIHNRFMLVETKGVAILSRLRCVYFKLVGYM